MTTLYQCSLCHGEHATFEAAAACCGGVVGSPGGEGFDAAYETPAEAAEAWQRLQRATRLIRKGDLLRIKPEWRDPGEKVFTYVAREDELHGHLLVSALELVSWPLWPTERVAIHMVERTGVRIEPEDAR